LAAALERAQAFPPLVLEARLATLEAGPAADPEAVRALQADAERAGHVRIARRAAGLLGAHSERSTSTGSPRPPPPGGPKTAPPGGAGPPPAVYC